ncbi:hypothetical protein [Dankookia sp. P2]|uniref:hypothetical protein n=1 Tax=Dankookia sp. P2 TaxID=3423955 RepID=UPI003D678E76
MAAQRLRHRAAEQAVPLHPLGGRLHLGGELVELAAQRPQPLRGRRAAVEGQGAGAAGDLLGPHAHGADIDGGLLLDPHLLAQGGQRAGQLRQHRLPRRGRRNGFGQGPGAPARDRATGSL